MIIRRDEAFRFVCNLRTPALDGITCGTGMFIAGNEGKAFLVTAAHVAKLTNPETIVAVQWSDGRCVRIPIGKLSGGVAWTYHPSADIALMVLDDTEDACIISARRCIPMTCLNLEERAPSRDDELTAIGFPRGLGIDGMFSPLTFRSFASSSYITFPRADNGVTQVFFCLENPSVGGYSGCPVIDLGYLVSANITQIKPNSVCHGIMHGTMCDDTGGKIALVTPMFYLRDLLARVG